MSQNHHHHRVYRTRSRYPAPKMGPGLLLSAVVGSAVFAILVFIAVILSVSFVFAQILW
jgi:hypothetical protein